MEKLILLPFTVGCISESSIPVVVQHTKIRSKLHTTTLTNEYLDSTEKLPPQNSFARFQKLFKNVKILSHLLDNAEEIKVEEEMEIDIRFPTYVKHVTRIGLDGFPSSDLLRSWNDHVEPEYRDNSTISEQ